MYGVPDPVAGDQVMACVVLRSGASLTPAELAPSSPPRATSGPGSIRASSGSRALPRTATFKVLTRVLAADRWNTSDPVWWRPDGRGLPGYVVLDAEQAAALDAGISPHPGR